jgi:transcriptional regulator
MDTTLPIVRGTLDLLVLKAIEAEPKHGFEVTSWIEDHSGGALGFDDSAVYQALYRLEKRGLLEGDWGVSANNRKARYYALTVAGRAHLDSETASLLRYSAIVGSILTSS